MTPLAELVLAYHEARKAIAEAHKESALISGCAALYHAERELDARGAVILRQREGQPMQGDAER